LKEWGKVSQKTKNTFLVGLMAILLSVLLVGYGNYLKDKEQSKETVSFVHVIK
jgi:L-rhamnose-H+ transport protein